MKRFIMFIALVFSCYLAQAESSSNNLITSYLDLIAKGKYEAAIAMLRPLAESSSTDNLVRGRAWTFLGFAYKEASQFQQARRCYEQALSLIGESAAADADRASVLNNFGDLQEELGNLPDAKSLLMKAAEIDERIQDHFRLATVSTDLAGIAIEEKRYKVAKKYLKSAMEHESLITGAKLNLLSNLYGTLGWLSSVTGDKAGAVRNFKQSLEASKGQFGNQHPVTGWSYLQLGKAFAQNGEVQEGIKNIRDGLAILETSAGKSDMKYLVGEVLYAQVLDQSGAHDESVKLGSVARKALEGKLKNQCAGCTVSAWSFH